MKQIYYLLLTSVLINLCGAIGRPPIGIEHNACKVIFNTDDELIKAKTLGNDQNARIEAYNKGMIGAPCKTYCRIVSKYKDINKELTEINSPDFIECGPGPRYCQSGKCKLVAEKFNSDSGTLSPSQQTFSTYSDEVPSATTSAVFTIPQNSITSSISKNLDSMQS